MKKLFLLIAMLAVVSAGCTKNENYSRDLKLSIDTSETIFMQDVSTSFTIIGRNGNYRVSSSNESRARVTLQDNKVLVDFLKNGTVAIHVIDDENHSETVVFYVSDPSLDYVDGHSMSLIYNPESSFLRENKTKLTFGDGNYSIMEISGNCAGLKIADQNLVVTPQQMGKMSFKVEDGRGSSIPFNLSVFDPNPAYTTSTVEYEMISSERLEIKAENHQLILVKLTWGSGKYYVSPITTSAFDISYCEIASEPYAQIISFKSITSESLTFFVKDETTKQSGNIQVSF